MFNIFKERQLYDALNLLICKLEEHKQELERQGHQQMLEILKQADASQAYTDIQLRVTLENIGNTNFLIDLIKNLAKYNRLTKDKQYLETNRFKLQQDAINFITGKFDDDLSNFQEEINSLVDSITKNEVDCLSKLKVSYNRKKYFYGALTVLALGITFASPVAILMPDAWLFFAMLFAGFISYYITALNFQSNLTNSNELRDKTASQNINYNIKSYTSLWMVSPETKKNADNLCENLEQKMKANQSPA